MRDLTTTMINRTGAAAGIARGPMCLLLLFVMTSGASAEHATDECEPQWVPTFGAQPGVSNMVLALTVFDDGSGADPILYAGGHFTTAGSVEVNHIAKWDGESWSALGTGMDGPVRVLTVFDDGSGAGPALYAGGHFTTAGGVETGGIAKWDGEQWSALGEGITGCKGFNCFPAALALAVFDDAPGSGTGAALYVGGSFITAGGVTVNLIAKWDGASWSALGTGMNIGWVHALEVFDDGSGGGPALYAGGSFTTAGDVEVNRIAKWDGEEWSALGTGTSGTVRALGTGTSGTVRALAVLDDAPESGGGPALYAGGGFATAGGVTVNRIAKWDGASWSALATGMSSSVSALTVLDDAPGSGGGPALYAGGNFTSAGGVEVNRIARWDGESWSALGTGMNGTVRALTVFDDGSGSGGGPALYAGGNFTSAGGVEANRIAKWDGESWSALGTGINNWVTALTVFDGALGSGTGPALYAGGNFTSAGGVDANRIAKWDGESWSALGTGMNNWVTVLTVFDDAPGSGAGPTLYAGGNFTSAGGFDVNRLAKWDGESWSALGAGMNNWVTALAVIDDDSTPAPGGGTGPALIAGGSFTASPGGDSYIAKWQGCPLEPPVPGDLNGDGVVDVFDLLILLSEWGECTEPGPGADCPADLNGDGVVDVFDLLILLSNWG